MTRARLAFLSKVLLLSVGVASAGLSQKATATPAPSLTVTPEQVRTRAAAAGPVPLWDTSWWITVHATRAQAPLTRLEYSARFADSADGRPHSGGWDLNGGDAEALNGRVIVKCPVRPDYDRRVRVQLRVRDAAGGSSEWVVADFPVREERRAQPAGASVESTPGIRPSDEHLGTVEVEAADDMTLAQTRAALLHKARARGGDAAVGFRLLRSTGDHATFAADVVRRNVVPPTPAAVVSDHIVGEIVFKEMRR